MTFLERAKETVVDIRGRAEDAFYRTIEFLRTRKRNYQLAFGSPAGQAILIDLAKFCRAGESCFNADQRLTDVLIGRHEVWLRIQQHLALTPNELMQLYSGNPIRQNGASDVSS